MVLAEDSYALTITKWILYIAAESMPSSIFCKVVVLRFAVVNASAKVSRNPSINFLKLLENFVHKSMCEGALELVECT